MLDIHAFEPIWPNWVIDSKIGQGSFGTVWKAHREDRYTQIVQVAAVKHISFPSDSDKEDTRGLNKSTVQKYYQGQLAQMVKEIQAMVELRGKPHIVSYEEHKIVEKEEGIGYDLFLRMELLTSLPEYINQHGNLNRAEVIKLGIQMAKALETLEAKNLIHRDIKPQNIFVDNENNYKLGDFGTARVLQGEGFASTKAGTPNYMAPEVYAGSGSYEKVVDIYSLGIVLYRYMNDGYLPFISEDRMNPEEAILKRMRGEELPRPKQADEELSKIILKACAFQPGDRYQSARELRKDLENLPTEEEQAAKGLVVQISIHCMLEGTHEVLQQHVANCDAGKEQVIHAPAIEGYEAIGLSSVQVVVDRSGNSSHDRVIFVYRLEKTIYSTGNNPPENVSVEVPLICMTEDGRELIRSLRECTSENENIIKAPYLEGYTLVDLSSIQVQVSFGGEAKPKEARFVYKKVEELKDKIADKNGKKNTTTPEGKGNGKGNGKKGKAVIAAVTVLGLVLALFVIQPWRTKDHNGGVDITPRAMPTETMQASVIPTSAATSIAPPASTVEASPAMTTIPTLLATQISVSTPALTSTAAPIQIPIPTPKPALTPTSTLLFPHVMDEGEVDGFVFRLLDNDGDKYAQIAKYNGSAETVVIPTVINNLPVKRIGGYAFQSSNTLTSITIPLTVTNIGERAFSNCVKLTSINIPSSVISIGDWAFDGSNLVMLNVVPGSYAEKYAKDNNIPTTIQTSTRAPSPAPPPLSDPKVIGEGEIEGYGYRLFDNGVEEYVEITKYFGSEFSITIPSKINGRPVRLIGVDAFFNCKSLMEISIPSSVTSIGERAFSDCSSLTSVKILDGVTNIGNGAFARCASLPSINIPSSVTSIGDYAFASCSVLKSLTLSSGLTTIGDMAFYHCISLQSIAIPTNVTGIGERAFSNCFKLTSVEIPPSVTSIGSRAFDSGTYVKLIVEPGSYAEQYAKGNNIPYTMKEHEKLSVLLKLSAQSVKAGEAITASWTVNGGVMPITVKEVLWVQLDEYGGFLGQTVGDVESNNGIWTSEFIPPGPRGSCAVYMVDASGEEYGIAEVFVVK